MPNRGYPDADFSFVVIERVNVKTLKMLLLVVIQNLELSSLLSYVFFMLLYFFVELQLQGLYIVDMLTRLLFLFLFIMLILVNIFCLVQEVLL